MKFPTITKNPLAINKRSTSDVSSDHITTLDVFKIKPTYSYEMMPKSSINMRLSSLTRTDVVRKPYYGNMQIITRFFFVPYRTVFKPFNDFITGTPTFFEDGTSRIVDSVPTISNYVLRSLLMTGGNSVESTLADYDFSTKTSNGQIGYRKLSNQGRYFWDILRCLGYEISFQEYIDVELDSNSVKMSALPLLAYFKVMADWYYNTVYAYPESVKKFLNFTGKTLNPSDVDSILNFCAYANYDQDKFVSAWDNPVAPSSLNSNVILSDISLFDLPEGQKSCITSYSTSSYTPRVQSSSGVSNGVLSLSQYIVDSLKSLTDFLQRRKLVGSKTLDRYLAEWGIKLPDANLNRSVFIGTSKQQLDVSDVTSTGDSVGASLGDYAAKAIGYNSGDRINYSADEFGQFVAVTTVIPQSPGYINGRQATVVKHLTPLDFFNGDFDGLGCSPIRVDEVKADFEEHVSKVSKTPDAIFGWMKRYYEYQIPTDRLTGDFRFRSKNTGLDSFYLFRTFPTSSVTDSDLVHSNSFVTGDSQYNRIFADTTDDYDHFYTVFHFDAQVSLPMSPLWDTYEFKHDGEAPEQAITIGGTRLN